jgi:hypothetical protein
VTPLRSSKARPGQFWNQIDPHHFVSPFRCDDDPAIAVFTVDSFDNDLEEEMSSSSPESTNQPAAIETIGFGLFLFVAGVVLLTQKLGWLPAGSDWFFPVLLIAWGASELYQCMR